MQPILNSLRNSTGILLLSGVCAISAIAQTPEKTTRKLPPLMPQEREIALALSAAPENLRKDATVYVLRRGGFVKVREGTNGFNCLVERAGEQDQEPICYDAEGSQTTMIARLRAAQLREQGRSEEDIEREIDEGYRAGKFLAPRKPGIAYMLSQENRIYDSRTGGAYPYAPHVMLYAPYFKNSDIGATPEHRGSHTHPWILHEGRPDAYIMIVPREKEEEKK